MYQKCSVIYNHTFSIFKKVPYFSLVDLAKFEYKKKKKKIKPRLLRVKM